MILERKKIIITITINNKFYNIDKYLYFKDVGQIDLRGFQYYSLIFLSIRI